MSAIRAAPLVQARALRDAGGSDQGRPHLSDGPPRPGRPPRVHQVASTYPSAAVHLFTVTDRAGAAPRHQVIS